MQLGPEPRATYAEKGGREHQTLRSSRQWLGEKPIKRFKETELIQTSRTLLKGNRLTATCPLELQGGLR